MSDLKRLKRKVLRQAVEENLEELRGQPRGSRRFRQRRRGRLMRWVLLTTLPALSLGVSTLVLSNITIGDETMIAALGARSAAPSVVELEVAAEATVEPSPLLPPEPPLASPRLPAPEALAPSTFSLGVHRIVLDPGHGGENLGTVAPGGMREKDLTLDISLRTAELLEERGVEVLMTRTGDESMALRDRTAFANSVAADLFVSIHVNWIEQQEVRGVETFYLGPTNDPYLEQLAAAENRGSDYSLADFRRLLQGVYAGVRQDESRTLASTVQASLLRSLRQVNPQLRDRGVKTAPFVVLVSSEMPAVLVEVACLSNQEEAKLLSKPHYRQFIARALAQGIVDYAHSLAPEPPSIPEALTTEVTTPANISSSERLDAR